MEFDPLVASQIAAVTITASVTLAGFFSGPGALRNRLKGDIELLEKLPPESTAHSTLLANIDDQLKVIQKLDRTASRDGQGAIIGAILVVAFGWLGFYLLRLNDWWWQMGGAVTLIFAAAGLAVVFEDLQRVPRDKDNKRI